MQQQNPVLKAAIEEYKRALVDMTKESFAGAATLSLAKRNRRPMATLDDSACAKFLALRSRKPAEFLEFLELAQQFEASKAEKDQEAYQIEQQRAEAEILGKTKEFEALSEELSLAGRASKRFLSSDPRYVLGSFASAFLQAIRRPDHKISSAIPIHTVEVSAILASA